MEKDIRRALIEGLEGEGTLRDALAYALMGVESAVMDEMDGMFGEEEKPKEVCKAKDPKKCWKHGFAGDILNKDRKDKARKQTRINPEATDEGRRLQKISEELQYIGWDLNEPPDSKADYAAMEEEMGVLKREAGFKRKDECEPYEEYKRIKAEYEEYKKEAARNLALAREYVGKKDIRKAEEYLTILQEAPIEIETRYTEVVSSYERACEKLMSQIEGLNEGNSPEDKEALKRVGMLNGETSKGYQKRMKRLKREKEIPETIKRIDEIVRQTERRWRSVAGVSVDEFETIKANWRKSLRNLMKRSALATNADIIGVNGILEDRFKSAHELGYSEKGIIGKYQIREGDDDSIRHQVSRQSFGVPRGLAAEQYEKYGCLHMLHPQKKDNLIGKQYGGSVIRWKPQIAVTTLLCSDSLCLGISRKDYVNPCLVTDPSPCCFNPENSDFIDKLKKGEMNVGLDILCHDLGTPYIELQYHGVKQYDASGIDSISFGSADDVRNLSPRAREAIKEHNIPCYIEDKPIKIEKYKGESSEKVREGKEVPKKMPFRIEGALRLDNKGRIIR